MSFISLAEVAKNIILWVTLFYSCSSSNVKNGSQFSHSTSQKVIYKIEIQLGSSFSLAVRHFFPCITRIFTVTSFHPCSFHLEPFNTLEKFHLWGNSMNNELLRPNTIHFSQNFLILSGASPILTSTNSISMRVQFGKLWMEAP